MKKSLIAGLVVLIIAVGATYKVASYGKPKNSAAEAAFILLTGMGLTFSLALTSNSTAN